MTQKSSLIFLYKTNKNNHPIHLLYQKNNRFHLKKIVLQQQQKKKEKQTDNNISNFSTKLLYRQIFMLNGIRNLYGVEWINDNVCVFFFSRPI